MQSAVLGAVQRDVGFYDKTTETSGLDETGLCCTVDNWSIMSGSSKMLNN